MCFRAVDHPSEESFPDDPIGEVFADVFDFDWHDLKLREILSGVLNLGCAVPADSLALELVFEEPQNVTLSGQDPDHGSYFGT